jgi:hypothetical protein
MSGIAIAALTIPSSVALLGNLLERCGYGSCR